MVEHEDDDAHLREHTVHAEQVYQGRLLDVRCDRVRLPDGTIATREYIVHPGAVMVVPLLGDGRLIVVRQYRYPLRRVMLEFPAGKLDGGESPFSCAIRELCEETGYRAAQWARAGVLHNALAYSNEGIEVWFARGLTAGAQRLDAGELVEVESMTLEALLQAAAAGTLTDAKTLIGLLWLQNWHNAQWPLAWHSAP